MTPAALKTCNYTLEGILPQVVKPQQLVRSSPRQLLPHSFCREHPAAHEAVAALARHIVMKAPDKADFRSLAADAAVGFIKELPAAAQSGYCAFLARLSRTPKVCEHFQSELTAAQRGSSARFPEQATATCVDSSSAASLSPPAEVRT